MHFQIALLTERFIALVTLEWFLFGVRFQVSVQFRFVSEHFVAINTLVSFQFFVIFFHVQVSHESADKIRLAMRTVEYHHSLVRSS